MQWRSVYTKNFTKNVKHKPYMNARTSSVPYVFLLSPQTGEYVRATSLDSNDFLIWSTI
jgi:hypothetical protein